MPVTKGTSSVKSKPKGAAQKTRISGGGSVINNNFYKWMTTMNMYYRNPDSIKLDTYEKMVDTDETVGFGIDFIILAALVQMGDYVHENKKIQKFIRENFELMEGNLYMAISELLSAIWAGHSTTEIIWTKRNGKWVLKDLQTLHPGTILYEIWADGENKNKLKNIFQFKDTQYEKIIEPDTKRIQFTYNKKFGNYYGKSILKRAYKNWFIKEEMLKAWAKAMIRHASPFPLLKSNNLGAEIELSDGTIVSNKEYLSLIVSQMYEGNGLLVDTDTEVDIIEAGKNISIDFEKIITYCNKMIFRALLIPSLVADAERAGSYALGKKHFEVFLLTTNNLIKWVTEALLEQLVRPLIEVNFRNVTDFGEWPIESIDEEDMNMFATLLDKLTTNGYLTPEELDDYNAVRTKVGFAPKEKLPDAILDKIRQRQLLQEAALQAQQNPQAPAQPGNNFPQKNNIPSKQGSAPAKPNAAPSKPAVEKPSNGNNIQTAQKASK